MGKKEDAFGHPIFALNLRILHRKGDEMLRTLVRNHVLGYSNVSGMQDEHADRGGAGVTIVKVK